MSERLYDFLKSLLDPERNGWAVTQEVRDEARALLGRFHHVGRETERERPGGERSGVGQETRCPLLRQVTGCREQGAAGSSVLDTGGPSVADRVQEGGGETNETPGDHA